MEATPATRLRDISDANVASMSSERLMQKSHRASGKRKLVEGDAAARDRHIYTHKKYPAMIACQDIARRASR